MKKPIWTAALAVVTTAAMVSAGAASPVSVTVNGTPLDFAGTPPAEVQGSVLVPLRGVFEALHASVNYNAATKVIYAHRGERRIQLPLGSTTATVDGQSQTLSQPAQVMDGTTLVPLRFVAQALGAFVQWHADTSTVVIRTQDFEAGSGRGSLPQNPQNGGNPQNPQRPFMIRGWVTATDLRDPAHLQLMVHADGQDMSLPFNRRTTFLRASVNQSVVGIGPQDVHAGDRVTVQRRPNGMAAVVTIVPRGDQRF